MAEVRVMMRGGLGNQLFQASAGLAASKQVGLPLVLDESYLRTSQATPEISRRDSFAARLGFDARVHSSFEDRARLGMFERRWGTARRLLLDLAPVTLARFGKVGGEKEKDWSHLIGLIPRRLPILLDGYFQKVLLFSDLEGEIRAQLTQVLEAEIKGLHCPATDYFELPALHIRLGDRLSLSNQTVDWYRNYLPVALSSAGIHYGSSVALYSDSPELAKEILVEALGESKVTLPPDTNDALQTLGLMRKHKLLIGAPSTLSWWAVFLQGNDLASAFMPSDVRAETMGIVPDTTLLKNAGFV